MNSGAGRHGRGDAHVCRSCLAQVAGSRWRRLARAAVADRRARRAAARGQAEEQTHFRTNSSAGSAALVEERGGKKWFYRIVGAILIVATVATCSSNGIGGAVLAGSAKEGAFREARRFGVSQARSCSKRHSGMDPSSMGYWVIWCWVEFAGLALAVVVVADGLVSKYLAISGRCEQ